MIADQFHKMWMAYTSFLQGLYAGEESIAVDITNKTHQNEDSQPKGEMGFSRP